MKTLEIGQKFKIGRSPKEYTVISEFTTTEPTYDDDGNVVDEQKTYWACRYTNSWGGLSYVIVGYDDNKFYVHS